MGQGSSTTNPYIPMASVMQDLERLKFSQNLRKNPEEYNAYVTQRVDEMTNEVFNRKRASFQKAHIDLGRYMDMDHNANYYRTRSGDVDRLTEAIGANNQAVAQGLARDKDVTKRQFEINEWYNYNKLETLFFLQLFFIAALAMAIVIFLQKNGTITNTMASLLTVLLGAITLIVGVYRYYYTRRLRDNRLWNRRYYGGLKKAVVKPKLCKDGDLTLDLNDLIPKSVTECADQGATRLAGAVAKGEAAFDSWQTNLKDEMKNYQTGNVAPKVQHPLGFVCDNLNNY